MTTVQFKSVSKEFGALTVLNDITLAISSGEFVVFVGPSGCGKSTLLRILAGLETATRGEVIIDDQNVNALPPKDRDIAMVFQNYALYPHKTVYGNMEFPLRNQAMPKAQRHDVILNAAKMLDLEQYLERYPRELSGGQRQRVAMGRAIVREPKVFLFDEPLSNLDAALRNQMRRETKLLHRGLQATMVYVTHDQVEAMTMADRIVVLKDGKIQQVGTPDEIYNAPANIFVAGFVGTPAMNFYHGELISGERVFSVTESGLKLSLQDAPAINERVATIGIRPEHVKIHPVESGRELNGRINLCESDGRDLILTAVWGESQVTVLASNQTNFRQNDPVAIEFPPSAVLLFDEHGKCVK